MKNIYSVSAFKSASWKGKDLFEAANQHPKASLEFKDLMEHIRLMSMSVENPRQYIHDSIYDFAYLIFGDKDRAQTFTDQIEFILSSSK